MDPPKDVKAARIAFEKDAAAREKFLDPQYDILAALGKEDPTPIEGSWTTKDFIFSGGRTLGSGGFGFVLEAKHKSSGYIVAVKFIHINTQFLANAASNECKIHLSAKHGHVVKCYGYFLWAKDEDEANDTDEYKPFYVCMVLEFCRRGTLMDVIFSKENDDQGSSLKIVVMNEKEAAGYVKALLEACYYLHKKLKVIHRDIKPSNVLIAEDGTAKLADFGIANYCCSSSDRRKTCVGTAGYTAPEVLTLPHKRQTRNLSYNDESDCWGVGVTLYVLLTGRMAFPPKHLYSLPVTADKEIGDAVRLGKKQPKSILPGELSKDGVDFLSRLLESDPKKRLSVKEALQHPWIQKNT